MRRDRAAVEAIVRRYNAGYPLSLPGHRPVLY
jgi:hypothetical protein